MSTHPESNVSSLLELIPSSQLEPHQIAMSKEGEKLPTYKFLRAPRTIDELKPYRDDGVLVSMGNGTLVFIRWFSPLLTTRFKKSLERHISGLSVNIFGSSDDAIVETAVFFGTLRSSEASASHRLTIIEYKDTLIFDAPVRNDWLSCLSRQHQRR